MGVNPDRREVGEELGEAEGGETVIGYIIWLYEKKFIFNNRGEETQVTYKRKIITSRVDLLISIIEVKNQYIHFIITCWEA